MNDSAMKTMDFTLERSSFGRLVLTRANGEVFEDVVPVRAFPIQAPEHGVALLCSDGREAAWIERLADLPPAQQQLVRDELAAREFMPCVQEIVSVTSFATPCTWQVKTDRGDTEFVLRGEEDIRRIGAHALLISDSHGIQFLIRDMMKLDRHSLRILDRFL